MIIFKDHVKKNKTLYFLKLKSKKISFKIITFIFLFIIISLYSLFLLESEKIFNIYSKSKLITYNSFQLLKNNISSRFVNIENFDLMIKDKDLKKINFIRELSNQAYISDDISKINEALIMRKENWVSAKIANGKKVFDVKVRLKGQSIDHWKKNFSLRVKVKNNKTIKGLSVFNLQLPKTRGYLNELFFHKILKFNNLIHLRQEYINFSINGGKRVIYNVEESFAKELIENNSRREGIIFRIKFSDSEFLESKKLKDQRRMFIDVVQGEKYLDSKIFLKAQINYVNKKLNEIIFGGEKPDILFDYKKMGKFYAISDLLGNRHFLALENSRFYFNPTSNLIEPVGYDNQKIKDLSASSFLLDREIFIDEFDYSKLNFESKISGRSNFQRIFFEDINFLNEYFLSLASISNQEKFGNFIKLNHQELKNAETKLYRSYPGFYLSGQYSTKDNEHINHESYYNYVHKISYKNFSKITNNIQYIKEKLDLSSNLILVDINFDTNLKNIIRLSVINNNIFPILLKSIDIDEVNYDLSNINQAIYPQKYNINNLFFDVNIDELLAKKINTQKFNHLTLNFIIPGINDKVYSITQNKKVLVNQKLNTDINLKNLDINNLRKEIIFKNQKYIFNEDAIFPKDYKVIFYPGAEIEINNSRLIFKSSIHANGTLENPVIFSSKDGNGGIAIIDSKDKSFIRNTNFIKLSYVNDTEILENFPFFYGAVNFYKSDVDMLNVTFRDSNSEDALNLISSYINLENIDFINSNSDSLDLDFVYGNLKNIIIRNSKNDGLDISGSKVEVSNIKIINSADKAISVGEKSKISIENFNIKNAYIGIAVKDGSSLILDSNFVEGRDLSIIEGTEYAITAYQKKQEFGSANIIAGNMYADYKSLKMINNKANYFIEKGSKLHLGNKEYINFDVNLFKTLYPQ